MSLLAIGYAVCGITCVLLLFWMERKQKGGKKLFWTIAVVLWVLVISSLWNIHGRQARRFFSGKSFRIWSTYHYYLGAKYFDELGYRDLYTQTLAADQEGPRRLRNVSLIRDLHTLEKAPRDHFVIRRSHRFSDKRWDEFKSDVNFFTRLRSGSFYREVLCDRGYNPTPFWSFFGSFLTNVFDIQDLRHRMALLSIDPAIGLLTIGICIWSLGVAPTAVIFLIFFLLPFNSERMFGGLLTYDWFYAMLLGIAFLNRSRGRVSAFFWAYAVMSRVFPAIFVSGFLLSAGRSFRRTRCLPGVHRRFMTAFAVFCCAGAILGGLNAYGPASWGTFRENISEHASRHISGARRIGLKKVFTINFFSSEQTSFEENLEKAMAVSLGFQAFLLLGAAGLASQKNRTDAMIWMLPAFFAVAVSSRYYWSVFGCLALLDVTGKKKMPSVPGSVCCLGTVACWYAYSRYVIDPHQRYVFMNILFLSGFIFLMAWEWKKAFLQKRSAAAIREPAASHSQASNHLTQSRWAVIVSAGLLLFVLLFSLLIPETKHSLDEFPGWIRAYSRQLPWEAHHAKDRANQVTASMLHQSLSAGKKFMITNQKPEGNFNYEYDFVQRRMSTEDHQVRQAGALWGLALIYRYTRDPDVKDALEKSLRFFFRHTRDGAVKGARVVAYPETYISHTGTTALTALAVIEYLGMERDGHTVIGAGFRTTMTRELDGYIRHFRYLQLDGGHFSSAYFLPIKTRYPKSSPYYDGETLLCLIKAAKYLGYDDLLPVIESSALQLAACYTREAWQKDLDSELSKGFFQWGCMAFWEYQDAGWPNAGVMADSLVSLAWWMIHRHRVLQRERNTAYVFEGIIHAYRLAKQRHLDQAIDDLAYTIDQGLYRLTSWQVGGPLSAMNPFLMKHDATERLAQGGVMNHRREAPLRIDVAQHQMHSVILALRYVYSDKQERD